MFPVAGKTGQDLCETHKYWAGVDIYSCLNSSTEDLGGHSKHPEGNFKKFLPERKNQTIFIPSKSILKCFLIYHCR